MNQTEIEQSRQRNQLQERVSAWLDLPLSILSFIMLGLLLAELTLDLSATATERITQAGTGIWGIFVAAFLVEFTLAPDKTSYLRRNWLTVISVALPIFRVVRVLRMARALRGLSLLRILTTLNRGAGALGTIVRRGQLGYILALTLIVTLTAASAAYFFERAQAATNIASAGEALWWAFTLVTTINSSLEVISLEARVVGLLLRLYAIAVSGYLTAIIAIHLLGWEQTDQAAKAQADELRALRREIAQLRHVLERSAAGTAERSAETE